MEKVKQTLDTAIPYTGSMAAAPGAIAPDSASRVLQALIDLYNQPVYIKDASGRLLVNEEASRLQKEGMTLPAGDAKAATHTFKGKRWKCERHDMNHNTGCVLYKLEPADHCDDPQIRKARECMMRLDAFFGAPKLAAPNS